MMVINNNLPALTTYDVVNNTSNQLQKSIQKLSTGLRINSAADDAAGLSISEKMRAQISGLDQAVRNTQDGISLIQTAEGALTETHSILQRMRELSVQAANDTYTQQDRSYIQEEIDQLRDEIDHIGNTTTFNTKKLLNGDSAALWSSDNLNTKALIRGGLRTIDQFGQKSSAEGNYKITVKADAGSGEVQKTSIFRIKHDVSPWYASVNEEVGIASADKQTSPDIKGGGTYTVTGDVIESTENDVASSARLVSHAGGLGSLAIASNGVADLDNNYNIKFTVSSVDTTNGTVTMDYASTKIGKDGQSSTGPSGSITLGASDVSLALESGNGLKFSSISKNDSYNFKEGEKFVYNVNAKAVAGSDSVVTINGETDSGAAVADHKFTINNNAMTGGTADFKVSYAETSSSNSDETVLREGDVYLTTTNSFADKVKDGTWAVFRKNVEIPETSSTTEVEAVTPEWQAVTNTTLVKSASAKNFDENTKITVTTEAAALNAGRVMRLGGDSYVTTGASAGLLWDSAPNVSANGLMRLELTDAVKAADSDDGVDHAHAKITFWGTGTDGAAYEAATWEGDLKANVATQITITDSSGKNRTASLGTLTLGANAITNGTTDEATGQATAGLGADFESGTYYFSSTAQAAAGTGLKMKVSAKNSAGETLASPIQVAAAANTEPRLADPAAGITYSLQGTNFAANTEEEVGLVVLNNTSGLAINTVNGEQLMTGLDSINWEKGSTDFGTVSMTLTNAAEGTVANANLTVAQTLATFNYGTWEKDSGEFDTSIDVANSSISGMAAKNSYTVSAQTVGKDVGTVASLTKNLIGDGALSLVSVSTRNATAVALGGADYSDANDIPADAATIGLSANGTIGATGYVKIERITNNNNADSNNIRVTFYGTTTDGTVMDGVSEDQEWGGGVTGTGYTRSLTVNGVELGQIAYDGALLDIGNLSTGSLANIGDSITLKVQAGAEEGDIAVTLKGTDGTNTFQSSLKDPDAAAAADRPDATDLPVVIIKKDSNVNLDEIAIYGPGGIANDNGELEATDFNSALGKISLKTSNGSISAADATAAAAKQVAKFDWTTEETEASTATSGLVTGKIKTSIGEVAEGTTKLRDLQQFWDSQGNFMLEDPQTLTLTQGNGKSANVTLYKYDTLDDLAAKLNSAIADDLGQREYVNSADATKFVTFVDSPEEVTSEAVEGTMIIRSIAPGAEGTITFSSNNEDLVNALQLNTLKEADDSVYHVTIEDAHTGKTIVDDEKITGNVLVGKLHQNVDVEFDSMTGISAKWNDKTKEFEVSGSEDGEVTYLHLSDNTTIFQIGANEGDDMGINIGDMRSHALGLDGVNVTNREAASRSITLIDSAIDKVSTQRAKLGAYQNRLEHTAANLTTSAENLTAAESRIRDTDMAKTMMDFTKLQIMLQAGNSMLAQANQLPQNVLSLIR